MSTPDVTPIQKLVSATVGLEGSAFIVLQAFNVHVTNAQLAAIGGATVALGTFLVAADAVIRHGRAKVAAAKAVADGQLAAKVAPLAKTKKPRGA